MKKPLIIILCIVVCIITCIILLKPWEIFAVGSFPYAEYYTFKTETKESLMERIKDFKEENPEYKFIRINFEGEKYEYPDYKNHMGYVVYFYFPDKNITIACVIKQGPDNPARLGFNSYSTGTNGGGWLNINKDIKKSESKELKKKFETEILNKIGGWSKK